MRSTGSMRSRLIVGLAVVVLAPTVCMFSGQAGAVTAAGRGPIAPAGTEPADPASVAESLRAVGFEVVDDPADAGLAVTVTEPQLEVMAAEVAGGSGMSGAELDAVTPMPDGAPPFSYLVAAWIHDAPTSRAQLAQDWYPESTDWTQAPSLLIPRAVLLMFVADVAEQADATLPTLPADQIFVVPADQIVAVPAGEPSSSAPVAGLRGDSVGAVCDIVSGFFTTQIAALFNQLRLRPDFLGGGVLGFVGGLIATLWDTAITLVGDAVQGLVRNLGAPVLEAIGRAIAVAGVISHISSYISGWNIALRAAPAAVAFPTSPAPPAEGRFEVEDISSRPWQADLQQCAVAFGIEIPHVLEPGSEVAWRVDGNSGLPDGATLITPTRQDAVIPSEGAPSLDYVTGTNDPKATDPGWGYVTVTATVSRADLTKVLDMARKLVGDLLAQLVAFAVPVPALADEARAAISSLVQPLLDDLAKAIDDGASSVFEMSGRAVVFVTYLRLPDPDPTTVPPPTSQPADPRTAFCAKLAEIYPLDAALMDWAGMGAAGIEAMNQLMPLGPAELADELATMMQMYQTSSTVSGGFPDEAVLALAEPFANASIAVADYCGFTAEEMMPTG